MGSLPDLTERTRPAAARASRTVSDPHRQRTIIAQIPVTTLRKKEWPWKKQKTPLRVAPVAPRRRDSAASSVGAASVRRLLTRPPQKLPEPVVHRFTLLCLSSGFCATALLPFTAFAGAEAGALPLALMHAVAAIVAPFSPLILQKTGVRIVIAAAHTLVFLLLTAHTVDTPLSVLLPLYGICGVTLSPMSLALSVSATSLAQAAGDEARRKVALRRALRALRAAQDLGLVFGSLMLGGALLLWPEDLTPLSLTPPTNVSVPRWPPTDDFFLEDDYEERTCGSAGCPNTQGVLGTSLSAEGRRFLVAAWAGLALAAVGLGVYGAAAAPAPPPDSRATVRDPRALLGAPMGLFIGLQQGFIFTSYIKWYGVCVGGWWCAWGVLIGTGTLQALAAGTLSMAAARGRRGALAAGGAAAHASLMLALLRWKAARTDLALPAVAAAAWGACAALWDVLQTGTCVGGAGWRGAWAWVVGARAAGLAAGAAVAGPLVLLMYVWWVQTGTCVGGAGWRGAWAWVVGARAAGLAAGAAVAGPLVLLMYVWWVQTGTCVGGAGWRGAWAWVVGARAAGLAAGAAVAGPLVLLMYVWWVQTGTCVGGAGWRGAWAWVVGARAAGLAAGAAVAGPLVLLMYVWWVQTGTCVGGAGWRGAWAWVVGARAAGLAAGAAVAGPLVLLMYVWSVQTGTCVGGAGWRGAWAWVVGARAAGLAAGAAVAGPLVLLMYVWWVQTGTCVGGAGWRGAWAWVVGARAAGLAAGAAVAGPLVLLMYVWWVQTGTCVGGAGWRGAWAWVVGARAAGLAAGAAARALLCVRAQLAALAVALPAALIAHLALERWINRGEAGRHRS